MAKPYYTDAQAEALRASEQATYEADVKAIRESESAFRKNIDALLEEADLNHYNLEGEAKRAAELIEARYDAVWWDEQIQMRTNQYNKRVEEIEQKRAVLKGMDIAGSQETPVWHLVYGTRRVPGVKTFITTDQPAGGEFLHVVYTLAAHPIDSVQTVYVNDEVVEWEDGVTALPGDLSVPGGYWGKADTKWYRKIFISTRTLGDHTTANSDLLSQSNDYIGIVPPQFPGQWTSNHKQLNRAHVYMILWFDNEIFADGYPTIEFLIKGNNKIYDPRTGVIGWSDNAALCAMNFLTDTSFGLKVPWSKIDTDDLKIQADFCDEIVYKADGTTEKRYTCNAFLTDDQQKGDQLGELITAFGGSLNYTGTSTPSQGKKWYIRPAVWPYSARLTTSTNYLSCSSGTDLKPTESFTVCAFIKMNSLTASGSICGRWDEAGSKSWLIGFDASLQSFYFKISADGNTYSTVVSNPELSPSAEIWYMLCARYNHVEGLVDNARASLWMGHFKESLDAADIVSSTFTGPAYAGTLDFRIGAVSGSSCVDCSIKTMGIWNSYLSNASIVELFCGGTALSYNELPSSLQSTLVSYWDLSETADGITSIIRADSYGVNNLTDSGVPSDPPCICLDENDILDKISIEILPSSEDFFNAVKGTFFDASDKYKLKSFPSIKNQYYLEQDGSEVRYADLALPATTSSSMAQRLAKIALEDARQSILVKIVGGLDAYKTKPGDVLRLSASFVEGQQGWDKKEFLVLECPLVISSSAEPGLSVALQLKEISPEIYEWAHGTETIEDTAPNITLPNVATVVAPTEFTASSGTTYLYQNLDGTIISRIYLSWTAPKDPYVRNGGTIEVEYKKSADASWTASMLYPGDTTFCYLMDVQDGELYDLRIRARNLLGARSSWVVVNSHRVVGKTAAPSDVPNLFAVIQPYGIYVSWSHIDDIDRDFYILRYGTSWEDGVTIAEVKGTSYQWANQVAGTYQFFIKAVDTSKNQSTNASSSSCSILAPSRPVVTATVNLDSIVLSWSESSGSYALSDYVLSYGDTVNETTLATLKSTQFSFKANFGGTRRFWIQGRDIAGNAGDAGTVSVTIAPPGKIEQLNSEVVDNNVILRWSPPSTGTLPLDYYLIEKGETTRISLGKISSTFITYAETAADTYTYWITPYDSAGNAGTITSVTVTVSQPPDYILREFDDINPLYCKRVGVLAGTNKRHCASFVASDTSYLWRSDNSDLSIGNNQDFSIVARFKPTNITTRPDAISNLTLWLDSSNSASITASDNAVSAWASRSGAVSFAQATGANKPKQTRNDNLENQLIYSEEINAAWPLTNATESGNLITASAGSAQHYVRQNSGGVIGGQSYVLEVDLTYGNYQYLILGEDNDASVHLVVVDMVNGTLGTQTNCTATISTVSAGRYRITLTYTRTNNSNNQVKIAFGTASNNTTIPTWNASGTETFTFNRAAFRSALADSTYLATTSAPQFRGINGRSTLWFDGSTSYMTSASTLDDLFNAGAKTVLVAFKGYNFDAGINGRLLADSGSKTMLYTSGDALVFSNNDGSNDFLTRTLTENLISTAFATHDTNLNLTLNGSAASPTASGNTSALTGTLVLGGTGTASLFFGGFLCELLTFDRVLTADELTAMTSYLEEKWSDGTSNAEQTIVSKWSASTATGGEYELGIDHGKLYFKACGSTTTTTLTATSALTNNDWVSAVAWYDHSATKLYLQYNAESAINATHSANINNSTCAFSLGRSEANGGSNYFDGEVSFVALWKRELTSIERQRLIDVGQGLDHGYLDAGLLSNCVACYDLNEESNRVDAIPREDSVGTSDLLDFNSVESITLRGDATVVDDIPAGNFYAPLVTGETWASYFTSNSMTNLDDFLSAGYYYLMQPTSSSLGYIERILDFGVSIGTSVLHVSRLTTPIVNTITDSVELSYSLDGNTFSTYSASDSLYLTGLRAVKVKISFSASSDKAFALINSSKYRLSLKRVRDLGEVIVKGNDYWGTLVTFNTSFLDVEKIVVTPNSEVWAMYQQRRLEATALSSPDHADYTLGGRACSLCFWVYFFTLPQTDHVLLQKVASNEFEYQIGLRWDDTDKRHYFYAGATSNGDNSGGAGDTYVEVTNTTLSGVFVRQWYHIVFYNDYPDGFIALKINNLDADSAVLSDIYASGTGSLEIGDSTGDFNQPDCLFRNLCIIDNALYYNDYDTMYHQGLITYDDLSCETSVVVLDCSAGGSLACLDSASLSTISTEMTLAFWFSVNANGVDEWINLVNKTDSYLLVYDASIPSLSFTIHSNSTTYTCSFDYFYPYLEDHWYFVVARYDGSNLKLFINNLEFVESVAATTIEDSANAFSFGYGTNDCDALRMCSAGLWSRAISDLEIKMLYNNFRPLPYASLTEGIKTGMISYWDMSESSSVRYDSHGENDLTPFQVSNATIEISPYLDSLDVWYNLNEQSGNRIDSIAGKVLYDSTIIPARALQSQGIPSFEDLPLPTRFGAKLYHDGIPISGTAKWEAVGYKAESGSPSGGVSPSPSPSAGMAMGLLAAITES